MRNTDTCCYLSNLFTVMNPKLRLLPALWRFSRCLEMQLKFFWAMTQHQQLFQKNPKRQLTPRRLLHYLVQLCYNKTALTAINVPKIQCFSCFKNLHLNKIDYRWTIPLANNSTSAMIMSLDLKIGFGFRNFFILLIWVWVWVYNFIHCYICWNCLFI